MHLFFFILVKFVFFFLHFHTEEPLKITKPLASIEVTEGQSIFLECTVSKPDRPAVWYKNDVKLSTTETIKLSSVKEKHSLSIARAELTDQAAYSIKVDGQTSQAEVQVIGKSNILWKTSAKVHLVNDFII